MDCKEEVDNIVELAAKVAGKADIIDDVLVLYTTKNNETGSFSNKITVSDAVFLMEDFKLDLLLKCREKKS